MEKHVKKEDTHQIDNINDLLNGQLSPGSLQSGQQPSNAILQMPHVSSWASQVHEATACHLSLTHGKSYGSPAIHNERNQHTNSIFTVLETFKQ